MNSKKGRWIFKLYQIQGSSQENHMADNEKFHAVCTWSAYSYQPIQVSSFRQAYFLFILPSFVLCYFELTHCSSYHFSREIDSCSQYLSRKKKHSVATPSHHSVSHILRVLVREEKKLAIFNIHILVCNQHVSRSPTLLSSNMFVPCPQCHQIRTIHNLILG